MDFTILTWNARSESAVTAAYLSGAINWVKANLTNNADIDFIVLQETGITANDFTPQIGGNYTIFKMREGRTRGDNYLFAIHNTWTITSQGYVDTDPGEPIGVVVRPAYKITVTNGGTTLDLYNFHNAFSTNGGSYVCLNVLGTQADNPHTVVAGDFNLDSENMNGLFTTFNDANNHYDHILTSSDITYVSSIVLDSDANGQPMQFVGGGSVTGSDHCPLFGSYQI